MKEERKPPQGWAELLESIEEKVRDADRAELPWMLVDAELLTRKLIDRLADPRTPALDGLITIPELAAKLKVDPATLYKRVRRGQMNATHVGRSVRVREEDFTHALRRGPRVKRLVEY